MFKLSNTVISFNSMGLSCSALYTSLIWRLVRLPPCSWHIPSSTTIPRILCLASLRKMLQGWNPCPIVCCRHLPSYLIGSSLECTCCLKKCFRSARNVGDLGDWCLLLRTCLPTISWNMLFFLAYFFYSTALTLLHCGNTPVFHMNYCLEKCRGSCWWEYP